MKRRRRIGPIVGAVVAVSLMVALVLAPAAFGRGVKGAYHGLPEPVREAIPDRVEQALGQSIDSSVRFFSFGNPDVLVENDLRLVASSPPPATWHAQRLLELSWTDLGHDSIRYHVRLGPPNGSFGEAVPLGETAPPALAATPPSDGAFLVWVQPATPSKEGRPTAFGPFLVDSTPPPAPALVPRADPAGYRFRVNWTNVSDLSGVPTYELERSLNGGPFAAVTKTSGTSHVEDQVGNGRYTYRVRAVNGAGLRSAPSEGLNLTVKAPMQNPGVGAWTYGVHANYTGFLHLWDLSDMGRYANLSQVPAALQAQYLGPGPGVEIENATLRSLVTALVGQERNTARIAEKLFVYLFDATDYNQTKRDSLTQDLQRAGVTLDLGGGICGDLAVLYLTLLRIAGVPARPVHGYLDNEFTGGGFHMWVEVWVGPVGSERPWMTVDVSGVSGDFEPADLFPYFGIFNPDYLALGPEVDYGDENWNSWARVSYSYRGERPRLASDTTVDEYAYERGCLYFNEETRRTQYLRARSDGSCSQSVAGFTGVYKEVKGFSKKRIDYGWRLESALPNCLTVGLRYPWTDEVGALHPSQSSVYEVYEKAESDRTVVGSPGTDGWVEFRDGTSSTCAP